MSREDWGWWISCTLRTSGRGRRQISAAGRCCEESEACEQVELAGESIFLVVVVVAVARRGRWWWRRCIWVWSGKREAAARRATPPSTVVDDLESRPPTA